MYRIRSCLFAGTSLALAIIATSAPSAAQTTKGEDGIGAGAGNSLPMEQIRGGAAMPNAASKMDAPPMPPDDGVGQAAPAPAPDQTLPNDGTKKDDGPPNPD
jgi:hypothetical protein